MPMKDQITDTTEQQVPWLFNNTALMLKSMANIDTTVQIPEAGSYYVYARSKAAGRGQSFRVALGKIESQNIRSAGEGFTWQRVGPFDLQKGETQLRLTRIVT